MFDTLVKAISDMKEDESIAEAKALLAAGKDPLKIVESCSAAMEIVGKRFENGEYFLPELMMGGELVRQVSEIVKPMLHGGGKAVVKKGVVVMGTVKGDIHNIGKDIVTFLLDVNGYEVHDVGVDMDPAVFVKAVQDHKPKVLGLSGLLTVAYDSMKDTVQAIEKAGLRDKVKIMIGGAQMSDSVAQYAGADAYGKDAMAGVTLTKQWIA
jgi:methanogenic corrinoid protein MtbC1